MKRFLVALSSFFILFFILEKSSWYFINNAAEKENDRRLEYAINGEFNKDIIILGSSRGANNILACQLEAETGLTSYNLSYRGVDLTFQAFVLESYLKFNKAPQKVLLFLDHVHTLKTEKTLSFRYDRLFPLSKYNYINNELIKRNKRSYASKFLGLLRLNKKDFNLKKKVVLPKNILTDCGSTPNHNKNSKKMIFVKENEDYQLTNESKGKLEAFNKIQSLCKAHNIELISVFSPNYKAFNSSFFKRYYKLMLPENRIMVYDTLKPIFKDVKIYNDVSHLLLNGAKIFTSEISTFINQNKEFINQLN
jgi:hypothetical protein